MQRLNYRPHAGYALEHLLPIEAALADRIDRKLLHLLKLRASQINGCGFCLHMHATEALADGESVERLVLARAPDESRLFDERERAALDYAAWTTRLPDGGVPDAVYERLRAAFSEQEIVDLTLAIGMINLWNRLAVALRVPHPVTRHLATAQPS